MQTLLRPLQSRGLDPLGAINIDFAAAQAEDDSKEPLEQRMAALRGGGGGRGRGGGVSEGCGGQ